MKSNILAMLPYYLPAFMLVGAGCGGGKSTTGDGQEDDAGELEDGRDGGDVVEDVDPPDGEDGVDAVDGADGGDVADASDAVDGADAMDAADAAEGEDTVEDATEITPECETADTRCNDDGERETCSSDGFWEADPCGGEDVCVGEGECQTVICEPGEWRCEPGDAHLRQQCNETGTAWEDPAACPDGENCDDGECLEIICEPGEWRCDPGDAHLRQQCDETGTAWGDPVDCPDGENCDGDECLEIICEPGAAECLDPDTLRICYETGTRYTELPCGEGFICITDTCVEQICEAGKIQCSGPTALEECSETGTEWVPAGSCNTDMDEICYEGDCLTLCQQADRADTSVGCVFYGVDMDQYDSVAAESGPFAIVVANTHESITASVTLEDRRGGGGTWRTRGTSNIAPESLFVFSPEPDQHVEQTDKLAGYGYRVTSTIPIIAYQFNPYDTATSYTSDASMLLPRGSLGTHYRVAAWHKYPGSSFHLYAYLTVAGTQDGTSVTITVPADTIAEAGGGIPAISAGDSYTTTVNEGDVLQIAGPVDTGDLTGALVEATAPVAVFGGSECADVPYDCDFCRDWEGDLAPRCQFCDHIEEQMYPVTAWGRRYIAARVPVRSNAGVEGTYWKIIAAEDDTTVSITYAGGTELRTSAGDPPFSLDAGGILDFELAGTADTPGDAFIDSDKPVLAVQYIEGQTCTDLGAGDGGDPAMILTVPMEQYLREYIFTVPSTYADNYIVIVKPVEAAVLLDGAAVSGTSYPVTTGWEIFRPSVDAGVHRITGTQEFGIIGVGYSPYVSYGYVGGLSLRAINPF
ncbi:MAG: hypothetical protein ABIJ56_08330 [Pseudomonadota bacterium]